MNAKHLFLSTLLLLNSLLTACLERDVLPRPFFCAKGEDLAAYVNPLIGTGGSGNGFPGALVPHGMVRLSPDTVAGVGRVAAYRYQDSRIEGFTHTHLQGPGGSAYGYSQILLMPATGPLKTETEAWASAFSHDRETATPGYYAVTLDDYNIRAELTATGHAGFHRYTFPAASQARVLIDAGHSLGMSKGGRVALLDDRNISGYGYYNVHYLLALLLDAPDNVTGDSKVYFHIRFNRPYRSGGTWKRGEAGTEVRPGAKLEEGVKVGAWAEFSAPGVVEARVGISMISEAQARLNLESEIGEKSFDEIHGEARARWNCHLNRLAVTGGSEEDKIKFYTGLYHTHFAPADYSEAGERFYSGADGKGMIFYWPGHRFYTDDWCAWDTFRTSRPLSTLVEPEVVDDVVASYLHLFRQGGWLPKCTWHATGYSRVMIGNHGVAIVADAFAKGFRGYDLNIAWAALKKSADEDNAETFSSGFCGYFNLGTPPEYIAQGYVSRECDPTQSVSMTLEYAYNDWCIAQVARGLGKTAEAERFLRRAQYYRNHWNPATGFMQARHRDGSWVEPLDPADSSDSNDFCEANAWIYSWFVPHDVPGLIELMGGDAAFRAKLDRFFAEGYFEISNEPSFHIPYLYNYAGRPDQAQALLRSVLDRSFNAGPGGLPGNDDAGATSAWFVFSAMGLFPVAPGEGVYQIGSPLFERVTLNLHPDYYRGETPAAGGANLAQSGATGLGHAFVIEALGNSRSNVYIQSATLNGAPLNRTWISHGELMRGGTLLLDMGPEPSSWGRKQ